MPTDDRASGGADVRAPFDLPCTHCGASPGVLCTTPSGRESMPHRARLVAFNLVVDERLRREAEGPS